MYPGPDDPDLGVFVRQMDSALAERGHDIVRAVLDARAGGKGRHVALARRVRAAVRTFRPDVVYAHFLVPAGLVAGLASRAPLVVTAHGQDVRNVGAIPGVRQATRWVCRRASALVAVSEFLRRELETKVPEARGKTTVADCGVDLERFAVAPAPSGPTAYLFVGTLTERKNVLRLAAAFDRIAGGDRSLTLVGDGPLRGALSGRPNVRLTGAVPHEELPARLAAAHVVCLPSLVEPLGQVVLEAMACGRPVVATQVGGPAELVPPGGGLLVDPLDVSSIASALERAALLPCPNSAARAAAEHHDVRRQAETVEAILERAAGRG